MFFLTKLATSATTHVDLTGKVLSTQFRLELLFFLKKDLKVSKQLVYIIEVQVLKIFERVPSELFRYTCGVP